MVWRQTHKMAGLRLPWRLAYGIMAAVCSSPMSEKSAWLQLGFETFGALPLEGAAVVAGGVG